MSTTIEEEVVSMKFDNRNFEKNVNTSISTIDKLKTKLNFKGTSDGLDELGKKAGKVSFSPLEKSVDAVQAKFSYFQATVQHQLNRIVDSAIYTGKKLVSAFTIDPVKTGFNEYELKMGSVQTIMASTGESLETVNKYLNELNTYSDKTIYSFSDMTTNIGKFTNAGVKLEDAVAAIKGISNEAAVSGANAQEASRAMYNFAQALSAGYVKLIDWKSIENANMATVEFKQELLNTALSLGTVVKIGDKYKTTTKNLQGKTSAAFDATHNFNDALNNQWMTTEVLTQTLARYADETTEIGKKAYASAQDVKTFSMMMDTLKEAAQSGWAQTWELFVGDFNEAKTLFTEASNFFGSLIDKASKARNDLLRGALYNFVSEDDMDTLAQAGKATENFKNAMIAVAKSHNVAIDEMIKSEGSFEKTLKSGWLTDDMYKEAMNLMTNAEREYIKQQTSGIKDVNKRREAVAKLTMATRGNDRAYMQLLEKMYRPSGRELVIDSIRNSLKAIGTIINSVRKSWSDVFPKTTSEQLYRIIEHLHSFSERLYSVNKESDKITRTFRGLFSAVKLVSNIFGGGFKIALKILQTILGHFNLDILDVTASIGDAIYSFNQWIEKNDFIAKGIDKVIAVVEKCVKTIYNWINAIKELPQVQAGIEILKNGFESFIERIKSLDSRFSDFVERVKTLDGISLSNIKNVVKDFYENIICYIFDFDDIFDNLKTKITNYLNSNGRAIDYFKEKVINCFNTIKEVLGNNNVFGGFLSIGAGVLILKTGKKLLSIFESLGGIVSTIKAPFAAVSNAINQFGGVLKAYSKTLKAKALISIALAIAILAGSLAALTLCDSKKLITSAIALGVMCAALAGLCFILGKFNTVSITKVSTTMISVAASLLILVTSLKKMETIKTEGLLKRIGVLGLLAAGLLAFSAIANLIPGMNKSALSILAFGVALRVLVNALHKVDGLDLSNYDKLTKVLVGVILSMSAMGLATRNMNIRSVLGMIGVIISLRMFMNVLQKITTLDLNKLHKSLPTIELILVTFAAVMASGRLAGKNALKAGVMIAAISLSLLIIIKAIKRVSKLTQFQINKGMKAITGIGLIFTALIAVSRLAGKNAGKAGVMLLAMSGTFTAVTICMQILGRMKNENMNRALRAVSVISACFALLIASTGLSKIGKGVTSTIITLTASVGAMAIAIGALSFIRPDKLDSATKALSKVMAMMSLLLVSTKFMGNKVSGKLLMAVGAIAAMSAVLVALSVLPTDNSIQSAEALSIMLFSLTGCLTILSHVKEPNKGCVSALYKLSGVVTILGIIIGAMSLFDIEASLKNVSALTLLLAALTGSLLMLDKIDGINKGVIKSLYAVSGVVVILGAILGVMSALKVEASLNNVVALSGLLLSMSGAMKLLDGIKVSAKSIIGLYAVSGAVAILAGIFGLMQYFNIKASLETTLSLSVLLLAMSTACVILSKVGSAAGQAIVGAAALDAVITIIAALVYGLGALFKDDKFLSKETLEKGFEILGVISYGLSNAIGKIIGGFADGVMSGLPAIGTHLSDFANNLKGFFEMIDGLDSNVVETTGKLAGALLAICAAELIDTITGWLGGSKDIEEFGGKLSSFAEGLVQFSNIVKNGNIDKKAVETAACVGDIVIALAKQVPNSGGILGWIMGDNDVDDFGEMLQPFAEGLVAFSDTVKGKIDKSSVETAKDAGLMIIELSKSIPNSGGILGDWLGNNDPDDFGRKLQPFAEGLVEFSDTVKGKIDKKSVEIAKDAGLMITELSSSIPNSGGILGDWFGNNDPDDFGEMLQPFAEGLVAFSTIVKEGKIDADAVQLAKYAGEMIIELANAVPKSNGLFDGIFTGERDIEEFGKKLKGFANGLAEVMNGELSKVSYTDLNTTVARLQDVVKIIATLNDTDVDDIKSFNKAFAETAKISIMSFVTEFANESSNVQVTIGNFFEMMLTTIKNIQPEYYTAGYNATQGFMDGLLKKVNNGDVYAAGHRIGEITLKAAKEALDIHSPSREMGKVAVFTAAGFINKLNSKGVKIGACVKKIFGSVSGIALKAVSTPKNQKVVKQISKLFDFSLETEKVKSKGKQAIDSFIEGIKLGSVKLSTISKAVFTQFELSALKALPSDSVAKYAINSYIQNYEMAYKTVEQKRKKATKITQLFAEKMYRKSSYYKEDEKQLNNDIKQLREYYNKSAELNKKLEESDQKLEDNRKKRANAKNESEIQSADNAIKNAEKEKTEIENSIKENNKNINKLKSQIDKDQERVAKNTIKVLKEIKSRIKDSVKDYIDIFNAASKKIDLFTEIEEPEKVVTIADSIKDCLTNTISISKFSFDAGINMLTKFSNSTEDLSESVTSANNEMAESKEDLAKAEKKLMEAQAKSMSVNGRSKKYLEEIAEAEEEVAEAKKKVAEAEAKVQEVTISSSKTMLENMKSNVDGYIEWQKDLETLSRTKISKGLLNYLTGLGISGAEQVHTFVQMTKEELEEANAYWHDYSGISANVFSDNIKKQSEVMAKWGKNIKKFTKLDIDDDVKIALLKEFQEQGIESAETLEYIISMSRPQLKAFSEDYKQLIEIPDKVSQTVSESFELINQKTSESKSKMQEYIDTMMANLQAEKDYQKNLNKLKKSGINDALYDELIEKGDKELIATFAKASKKEIEEVNKIYDESAKMAADTWIQSYEDRLNSSKSWNNNMKWLANLTTIPAKMREELYNEFEQKGIDGNETLSIIRGFTDKQMEQFVKDYEKGGKYASVISNNVLAGLMAVDTEVQENIDKNMGESAKSAMTAYDDELKEGQKKIKNTVKKTGETVVKTLSKETGSKKMDTVAQNTCQGLADGVKKYAPVVDDAFKSLGKDNVVGALTKVLQIKSPSRVTKKLGRYCDEGLALGLKEFAWMAEDATLGMTDNILNNIQGAVLDIASLTDMNVDTNPTIKPVLDMDELKSQIGTINGMFKTQTIEANVEQASRIANRMNKSLANQNSNITNNTYDTFSPTYDNKFYITGDNSKDIADEVNRRLQQKVKRRSVQWG